MTFGLVLQRLLNFLYLLRVYLGTIRIWILGLNYVCDWALLNWFLISRRFCFISGPGFHLTWLICMIFSLDFLTCWSDNVPDIVAQSFDPQTTNKQKSTGNSWYNHIQGKSEVLYGYSIGCGIKMELAKSTKFLTLFYHNIKQLPYPLQYSPTLE